MRTEKLTPRFAPFSFRPPLSPSPLDDLPKMFRNHLKKSIISGGCRFPLSPLPLMVIVLKKAQGCVRPLAFVLKKQFISDNIKTGGQIHGL